MNGLILVIIIMFPVKDILNKKILAHPRLCICRSLMPVMRMSQRRDVGLHKLNSF